MPGEVEGERDADQDRGARLHQSADSSASGLEIRKKDFVRWVNRLFDGMAHCKCKEILITKRYTKKVEVSFCISPLALPRRLQPASRKVPQHRFEDRRTIRSPAAA